MSDDGPPPPKLSVKEATDLLLSTVPTWELDTFEWKCLDGRTARVRCWKNAPPTLRAFWDIAKAFGDNPYVVQYDSAGKREEVMSYAQTDDYIGRWGAWLAEIGLKKGDRVSAGMRNFTQYPITFFGTTSLGIIFSALNAWFSAPELAYVIRDSDPSVLILDRERFSRLHEAGTLAELLRDLPGLKRLVLVRTPRSQAGVGSYGSKIVFWEDIMERMRGRKLPECELHPDEPATIYYSSGTTGQPKGCLAPHRSWTNIQISSPFGGARQLVRRGDPFPPPPREKPPIAINPMPCFHGFGIVVSMQMAIQGGTTIYPWKWDASTALKIIQAERVTALVCAPSMIMQVLEHPDFAKYDTSSLEAISSGGAPASAGLGKDLKKKASNVVGGNGYGLTECNSCIVNLMDDFARYPTSIGLPTPVCEAKVMSLDGAKEMPRGQVGELWLRSSHAILGYWKRNDANATSFSDDGFYKTGDGAWMNDEGFIFLADRLKQVIIRGAENVYAVEVENALYSHPAVMEAAAVGIPDRILGELVGAVVVLKPGQKATMQELIDHAKGQLAAFKVPEFIDIRHPVPVPGEVDAYEGLPKNATAKIDKRLLKAEIEPKFAKHVAAGGSNL